MDCCIHCEIGSNTNDRIIQVSEKSGKTLIDYAREWIKTQDEYGSIASKLLNEIVSPGQTFPASCGYHRRCYQRFTNKKNLESSKKRSMIQASDDDSIPRYVRL